MSKQNRRRISDLRPAEGYEPRTNLLERIKKANQATKEEDTLLTFVSIGQDEALDLLSINTWNRDVMIDDPVKLANDMISDRWHFLGTTFMVDWDGNLRNGQKESAAIVIACERKPDLRLKFHIQCKLDPKSAAVMDVGRVRSISDALKDAGFTDTNHLAAAIRTIVYLKNFQRLGGDIPRGKKVDNQTVVKWTENLADTKLLQKFLAEAQEHRKTAKFFTKTAWATIKFVLHKVAKDDAQIFIQKLAVGDNLDLTKRKDYWINVLRNKLLLLDRDPEERNGFRREDERYRLLMRAWNNFRNNTKFEPGEKLKPEMTDAKIEKPI